MDPWAAAKIFKLVWRRHQLLSGFLTNVNFLSVTSVPSVANDRDDNDMMPGAENRSLGISYRAGENPRKNSARRPSMKTVRPVIASNEVGKIL